MCYIWKEILKHYFLDFQYDKKERDIKGVVDKITSDALEVSSTLQQCNTVEFKPLSIKAHNEVRQGR